MNDRNQYYEYIKNLSYEELINIESRLDKEKFPDRYKILVTQINGFGKDRDYLSLKEKREQEIDKKINEYVYAFIGLAVILLFEQLIKNTTSINLHLPQTLRFLLIVVGAFIASLATFEEFENEYKSIHFLILGGISFSLLLGILPRTFDSGIQQGIKLALLKENILSFSDSSFYSRRANFIVPVGYYFAIWAMWCFFLNKMKSIYNKQG